MIRSMTNHQVIRIRKNAMFRSTKKNVKQHDTDDNVIPACSPVEGVGTVHLSGREFNHLLDGAALLLGRIRRDLQQFGTHNAAQIGWARLHLQAQTARHVLQPFHHRGGAPKIGEILEKILFAHFVRLLLEKKETCKQ